MSENKLLDLSLEFAVAVVNLADSITTPKSSYMTDQLARAGTSIGANRPTTIWRGFAEISAGCSSLRAELQRQDSAATRTSKSA